MSVAASVVSCASVLLSGHAKLDVIASDGKLVKETRDQGHKIISASTKGGYGNAGAWALVRRIEQEDLGGAMARAGVTNVQATQILADGSPLWHVVVTDMLHPDRAITCRLCLEGYAELMERLVELVVDPLGNNDLTVEDLHMAVEQLEPLLKLVYDQAKADSKWKAQVAYCQVAPNQGLRKTLLNYLCDHAGDAGDLVGALLKYTPEALRARRPERLQVEKTAAGTCRVQLPRRSGLPAVAVGERRLEPGEEVEIGVEHFGSSPDEVAVGLFFGDPKNAACMPGATVESVGVNLHNCTINSFGMPPERATHEVPGDVHSCCIKRWPDGHVGVSVGGREIDQWPCRAECWPAIGVWSSGARLTCSRPLAAVAADRPWLVLADVQFGFWATAQKQAEADIYGNAPFHCCAYNGNARCLSALVKHAESFSLHGALKLKTKFEQTPLEVAVARKQGACQQVLQSHEPAAAARAPTPADAPTEDGPAAGGCSLAVLRGSDKLLHHEMGGQRLVWDEVESHLGVVPSGSPYTLKIRDMHALHGDGREIGGLIDWSLTRCSELFWTQSAIPPEDFIEVVDAIVRHLTLISKGEESHLGCTWNRIGLGMRPQGADGEMWSDTLRKSLADAFGRLIAAISQLPPGRAIKVTTTKAWKGLFPPECQSRNLVLSELPSIHQWWRDQTEPQAAAAGKGKGRGKGAGGKARAGASANPLSMNPFVPGLCLLRGAAFDSSWQLLLCKSDFVEAIHPSTGDFLRQLVSSWAGILENYRAKAANPDLLSKLSDHLRQALGFISDMKDFAPMCQQELNEALDLIGRTSTRTTSRHG